MDYAKLASMLERAPETTIAVFGDYCLDKYLYIDPSLDEPSVETGLTAYQVTGKGIYPGGAGTVANNLLALGARVLCVGVRGDDGEGYELVRELGCSGADSSLMVTASDRCTNTYTKPMRGRLAQSAGCGEGLVAYAEMNRLDFRNFAPMSATVEAQLISNLREAAGQSAALMVLDQFVEPDLGTVNSRLRAELSLIAHERPDLIMYADSRAFIHLFRDSIVKCNNLEVVRAVEPDLPDLSALGNSGVKVATAASPTSAGADLPSREMVLRCAQALHERNGKPLYVTLGEEGMAVLADGELTVVPGVRVTGPIDTCGAGDAASSGIVLGLSLGASPSEAALIGNMVASITVQQIGVTGTATPEQVLERYRAVLGARRL